MNIIDAIEAHGSHGISLCKYNIYRDDHAGWLVIIALLNYSQHMHTIVPMDYFPFHYNGNSHSRTQNIAKSDRRHVNQFDTYSCDICRERERTHVIYGR